jgi:hypothetical protein
MGQSIDTIKINIAYDDINKPNLYQYDIRPQWIIDIKNMSQKYLMPWLHIDKFLGNQLQTFNVNSLEYFSNSEELFIYPITLYCNFLFEKYETIDISDILLKSIKSKKCKIVFFYITEGYFGETKKHFEWLDNLVIKYNLDNDDILVITANLTADINYTNNKFKIVTYNYFGDELEFAKIIKKDKSNIKLFKNKYLNFIDNFKLEKHFLCFNNLTKLHRLWVFYELMNNSKLLNKSIVSLNSRTTTESFFTIVSSTNNINMIDYFKNYNSDIGYSYDTTNWTRDVQVGDTINTNAHLKTFVNIVTETLTDKDIIFITEKTYKPIYVCQPFIIVGNAYTLKKMKELGYKTFDKWWDESYDEEIELEVRMNTITKILEEIASWDLEKCAAIRKEMKEILIHNYNQMLNNDEQYKIYSVLQTGVKQIKKSII